MAIGRALARKPSLFLFDEPLSNLDAKLRVDMRAELKKLHMSTGVTTIYVTHDQVEAMTLGTRIAVLKDGLIQQLATPMELYARPANLFVAGFIGSPSINLCDAEVGADGQVLMAGHPTGARLAGAAGRRLRAGVRPEDLRVEARGMPARVTLVEPTGAETYVLVQGAFGEFTLRLPGASAHRPGDALAIAFDPARLHLFDAATGLRVDQSA